MCGILKKEKKGIPISCPPPSKPCGKEQIALPAKEYLGKGFKQQTKKAPSRNNFLNKRAIAAY